MALGVANVWVLVQDTMLVQDTDRAVNFYENTLGLSVVKRDGPWAEVEAGGLCIGLNGAASPAERGPKAAPL